MPELKLGVAEPFGLGRADHLDLATIAAGAGAIFSSTSSPQSTAITASHVLRGARKSPMTRW